MTLANAASISTCQLPYPERYEKAVQYAAQFGVEGMAQDSQLMLYALKQQVTEGPAASAKSSSTWSWSMVEAAKGQAWKQLGNMSPMEAMRLYVRTLDEERPDWYAALLAASPASTGTPQPPTPDAKPANGAASASGGPDDPLPPMFSAVAAAAQAADVASFASAGGDKWTVVTMRPRAPDGRLPCPRYEHGAALLGHHVYVIGGNYAGRYLSDVWRLDLTTSCWEQVSANPKAPAPPSDDEGAAAVAKLGPVAGHTVTLLDGKLLVLGGHLKARSAAAAGPMAVRLVDPEPPGAALEELAPIGKAPPARGGHTATIVGGRLWVFGGEDAARRPLDDLYCLDLATLTWSQPLTKPAPAGRKAPPSLWPSARSAHSAVAVADRYLVIFGGGSAATCSSDVHILDTGAEGGPAWLPAVVTGAKASPRAGHSAVVHGHVMYIVGGGNNIRGCTEILALDLSALVAPARAADEPVPLALHVLGSTPARDPLSSEGIALIMMPQPAGSPVLLAIGGYNGKYHNTVSVLRAPALPGAARHDPARSLPASPSPKPPTVAAAQHSNGAAAAGATLQTATTPAEAAPRSPAVPRSPQQPAAPPSPPPPPQVSEAEALRAEVARLTAALSRSQAEAESAVRAAAAAKEGDAHELALLRKQLATSQAALETASKGLEEARAALAREGAKVLKLEAEAAELQHQLAAAAEERKELEGLRRQAKEAATAPAKGVWGYLTGQ